MATGRVGRFGVGQLLKNGGFLRFFGRRRVNAELIASASPAATRRENPRAPTPPEFDPPPPQIAPPSDPTGGLSEDFRGSGSVGPERGSGSNPSQGSGEVARRRLVRYWRRRSRIILRAWFDANAVRQGGAR